MICIGFAGYEAFDIILYMGRTLARLNYPLLIIDLSDSGALKKAIYHGMGLDSSQVIVNYRNINYLRRTPSEAELMMFQEGVILIDYGFHSSTEVPLACNVLNIVVSIYPHIIDKINTLLSTSEWKADKRQLLHRDIITPDDIDRVISKINFQCDNIHNYLYLDLDDYYCAVNCQVKQSLKFVKLSSGMKKYIIGQIHGIFPQIKMNKIKKAFISAGKGR